MKLPKFTHGVSARFFGGAESPEAEKEELRPIPLRQDGFLRRGTKKTFSPKKIILDILFPIHCLSCRREGNWLCRECSQQIEILTSQVCPLCERVYTPAGLLCQSCRISAKSNLNALVVCASYENQAVKNLIYKFKYNFISELATPLAGIITNALLKNELPLPDIVVPVPLHPRRLRWRGFNQSHLLAEKISSDLAPLMKIRVLEILKRNKWNRPQMKIKNYKKRTENVKNIFHLESESPNLKNKTVLLVDDIATTGATLQECAKILKKNGAKKVFATVIARQTLKK